MRKKNVQFSISPLLLILSFFVLSVGISFIYWQNSEINYAWEMHDWPTVHGSIIHSEIVGKRAFRPEISYQYQIDGIDYVAKTDLHISGFGNKRSRRDTAERIIREYQKGTQILIHYDPMYPKNSYLRIGPYWSNYMILGVGMLLFGFGLFGILSKFAHTFFYQFNK